MIPSGTAVTLPRTELRRPQPHQISESGVLGASGHCTRAVPHSTPLGEMEEHHHERGEMTSKGARVVFKHGILSSLRRAALIAVLAGAGASLAFMLRASHRQNSRVLLLLFGIWVLFPFITAVWAYVVSNGWTVVVRVPLYMVMLVVSLVSLSIYGGVAFRHLRAKVGFVFLVVPLASWLVIAIAVSMATVVSRRQSRRAGDA